eukprot:4964546-Amphidinium_carterae.1
MEETPQSRMSGDLLASTGTALYVWRMEENQAPLTAFDWSVAHNNKVGVSSVDTTCTIWDLERERIETQLIAHDKACSHVV